MRMSNAGYRTALAIFAAALSLASGIASAEPERTGNPYAPYAFLIGEWDTAPQDAAVAGIRQSLRWGPSNSYIWYAVTMRQPGQTKDHLHQEGMMTFNAQRKALDFLFVQEPGSFAMEQGTVHVEADGSIVRETVAIDGNGTETQFRQIFRRTGANTAITSLMRKRADGSWTPTFPGSENLIMTRRTS